MYNYLLIRWKFHKITPDQLQALVAASIITPAQKDAILAAPQV